jgi:hypothetical protein
LRVAHTWCLLLLSNCTKQLLFNVLEVSCISRHWRG